jgi:hypothetical protein
MNRIKLASGAVFLALALSVTLSAGSISVYVAYADNLRPSGFFPTPWLGGTGVVSQSATAQSFDSSAIRVDNNTGASITISDFMTTFNAGAVMYNFWSPLVIPDGGHGIFTQTFSYNFDTSDFGFYGTSGAPNIDATHPLGGCTNPQGAVEIAGCLAYQPKIAFSTDAGVTTLNYTDTGHILDTFGYDFINGSPDGNESINWNLVGSTPTRGGTVPEPGTYMLLGAGLGAISLGLRRKRMQGR